MDAATPIAPDDLLTSLMRTRPLVALTSPVIYSLIIPFALADLWVSLYQAICFRAYRIKQVKRAPYFTLDRAKLPYLSTLEKLNCVYCSYINGVIGYVREIAARTEQYWCPIKEARKRPGAHDRYPGFTAYGDEAGLDAHKDKLRAGLRMENAPDATRVVTRAVRPARWRGKAP